MSSVAVTSWSEEPALSGWLITACLAVSALILLGAGLIQQSSRISALLSQISQPMVLQAETTELSPEVKSEVPVVVANEYSAPDQGTESEFGPDVWDLTVAQTDESGFIQNEASIDTAEAQESALAQSAESGFDNEISLESKDALSVDEINESSDLSSNDLLVGTVSDNFDAATVSPEQAEAELSLASLRKTVLDGMSQRSTRIKFAPGEARLARGSEALLALIFEDLFLYSESDIVIEVGSQDAVGNASNSALSNERAAIIKTYLADRGLPPNRLIESVLPASTLGDAPQLINIEANLDE